MALNDPAIDCTNNSTTFEEHLAGCIGTDASGNPTLRVVNSVDAGTNYIGCSNNAIPISEHLRNLFCLDSNGNKAIRISITNV